MEFAGLSTSSDLAALGHLPLKGKARATAAAFSKSLPLKGKARVTAAAFSKSLPLEGKVAASFDADG